MHTHLPQSSQDQGLVEGKGIATFMVLLSLIVPVGNGEGN